MLGLELKSNSDDDETLVIADSFGGWDDLGTQREFDCTDISIFSNGRYKAGVILSIEDTEKLIVELQRLVNEAKTQ
jgi:hypothetical protein